VAERMALPVNGFDPKLAAAAYEVMLRRGWSPRKSQLTGDWYVWDWLLPRACVSAEDPFAALVWADCMYPEGK
jgi:hypothetical protein